MNKDKLVFERVCVAIFFLVVIVLFLILIICIVSIEEWKNEKEQCEDYSNKGYYTLPPSDWNFFNFDKAWEGCKIIMEDGTLIDIKDFELTILCCKKPMFKEVKPNSSHD